MSETYNVPEYAELAFHYANKDMWFNIDKIIVPFPVDDYKGEYRVDGALDWYRFYSGEMSKAGYPEEVKLSDSLIRWETNPRGLSYSLDHRKLSNFRNFSYTSREQMKMRKWQYLANSIKINREVLGVQLVEDDTNYDSGQVYTINVSSGIGTAAWSDKTNGTPLSDTNHIKRNNRWLTDMGFNYLALTYLMESSQILDAGTGDGPHPDMSSPIEAQLGWLSKIFGLRCHVFMAEAVENNIDDPTTQSKTDIWGNYVWYGRVDKESQPGNLEIGTWAHEYRLTDNENAEFGGFSAVETVDSRRGSKGWTILDLKYDNQNKVYAQSYGAKLKSIY